MNNRIVLFVTHRFVIHEGETRVSLVSIVTKLLTTHRCRVAPTTISFQNGGLGGDVQEVPALEGVDGFVWHQPHVRGLEVERLRTAPVEPHDRIERRRY